MANKEALRELQNRLAERMKAVRAEQPEPAWLAVDCAGHGVLFPLHEAGEIFDAPPLVPVPHAKTWLAGVANLRGGLYAVVDLAVFLGLRGRQAAGPERRSVVALNARLGLNCALLVDRLEGLRKASDLRREPPNGQSRPAFAAARWTDGAGRAWQEIALTDLAAHEMFLGIAG
jgi:twitching motility protein PilI